MFRNLIIVTALALAVVFTGTGTANAGKNCDTTHNACAAFWKQMYESEKARNHKTVTATITVRQQVKVQKKTTTVSTGGGHGTVCVYARVKKQKSTSAVVLYVGGYSARSTGKVLKTWGDDGWTAGPGGFYKRLCLDGDLIAGQKKVTICGIDGHNTWSKSDIAYLLRVKSIGKGDPANMYGGGKKF